MFGIVWTAKTVFEVEEISYFAYVLEHSVDWPRIVCNA